MTYFNVCTVQGCPNREITAGRNCGGVQWDEHGNITDWGIVGEPGPKGVISNADLLRAEPDEGLADAIFYTLSEFQSKEALLAYLREEVKSDA